MAKDVQPVELTGSGRPFNGKTVVTTPGLPVYLAFDQSCRCVLVTANKENSGNVYIFKSGQNKSTSKPLAPGEWMKWDISNLNLLQVDADNSNESVFYEGVV